MSVCTRYCVYIFVSGYTYYEVGVHAPCSILILSSGFNIELNSQLTRCGLSLAGLHCTGLVKPFMLSLHEIYFSAIHKGKGHFLRCNSCVSRDVRIERDASVACVNCKRFSPRNSSSEGRRLRTSSMVLPSRGLVNSADN